MFESTFLISDDKFDLIRTESGTKYFPFEVLHNKYN